MGSRYTVFRSTASMFARPPIVSSGSVESGTDAVGRPPYDFRVLDITPRIAPARDIKRGNGDHGQPESAQERLQRFAIELFVDEHPSFRPLVGREGVDLHGLEDAAEDVLGAHQRALLKLESPVEQQTARKLARDRYQAITALIHKHGDRYAKETQLRICDGAPLTICMGDVCRIGGIRGQTVTTMLGEVRFAVKGCRAIFPDVTRTDGGKMWPGLCPACRSANSKPARAQRRALKRRLNGVWQGDTATIYAASLLLPPPDRP
jgi:hypothetical protein